MQNGCNLERLVVETGRGGSTDNSINMMDLLVQQFCHGNEASQDKEQEIHAK
jgi:hypothetical protein